MGNDPLPPRTEHLDTHQCWALLRSASLGRLAMWHENHPEVFPVNYIVDRGTLVVRTGAGTKLAVAAGNTEVAFEVDGVSRPEGEAWSVVVKATMQRARITAEFYEEVIRWLFPWESGAKDHFIRIIPFEITGRRFTLTPPLTWWLHPGPHEAGW
jgi:uncharacterized protein